MQEVRADDPKLKRMEPPRLTLAEKFFLPQIGAGLAVTARHIGGVALGNKAITVQYPEEQHVPSPNYRGVHRLNKDEQGRVKCVACMLCATACPAHCIHIEAGEVTEKRIEKYPSVFEIDLLRCVMCGLCVDACPEEALIMSEDYELGSYNRDTQILRVDQMYDGVPIEQYTH